MPKGPTVHIEASELREKILAQLRSHAAGMRVKELAETILGKSDDLDEARARASRITFAMRALLEAKHVRKGPMNTSPFFIREGRPEPNIADIPANARRGRPKGSKNGVANGSLRSYILRDIRAKLAELEALES
jgi:hypothetical protein